MMAVQDVRVGLGRSIEMLDVLREQFSLHEQFPDQFAAVSDRDCEQIEKLLATFNDALFGLVSAIQAELLRVAAEQRRQFPPPSSAN